MHRTKTHSTEICHIDFADKTGQPYLSFRLGNMEYGLDVHRVQELCHMKSLGSIVYDGAVVKGVAISRGVIIPIVDMRTAFGSTAEPDPLTDVIILKLSNRVMGMVVDGVTDVVTLSGADIGPIPGASEEADYLLGLGRVGGRRLILVDIDKLMSVSNLINCQQPA